MREHWQQKPVFYDWKIIGVACIDQHTRMWHMPIPGFRHNDVLSLMRGSGSKSIEEGFQVVNHLGKTQFASRKLSLIIAKDNGQLRCEKGSDNYHGYELYSEGLW